MKYPLLFSLLLALPLVAAERGFNDYRFRTNSADMAVSKLDFNGKVLPATVEKLKEIWNSGTGREDRMETLYAWMKELGKDPHSTDDQVFLAWQAARVWFDSHGKPEHDLFLQHIRHTFSSPEPTENRALLRMFYDITSEEYDNGGGCTADDLITLADAVNGVHPWLFPSLYPNRNFYHSRMDALLPPASPLRAELLQNGCTIEIPHSQEFGNRNAATADDVRLDVQVKPLFPQAENAALCQAAAQGRAEEVQRLLSAGAAAHAVDAEGNPALFLACRAGNAAAVKLLLEHGADAAQRQERVGSD